MIESKQVSELANKRKQIRSKENSQNAATNRKGIDDFTTYKHTATISIAGYFKKYHDMNLKNTGQISKRKKKKTEISYGMFNVATYFHCTATFVKFNWRIKSMN